MKIRSLKVSDIPALRDMAARSGYPYPDLASDPTLEAVLVVVDDEDRPLRAAAAKRLVELYFWCDTNLTPHENLAALRLLYDGMVEELRAKGYHSAEAFLPESVSRKFGRRLERTFGFMRNWPSWT